MGNCKLGTRRNLGTSQRSLTGWTRLLGLLAHVDARGPNEHSSQLLRRTMPCL